MLPTELWRTRDILEPPDGMLRVGVGPEGVEDVVQEGSARVETDSGDSEGVRKPTSPSKEEVGEKSDRGVGVRLEPLDYGILEFGEGRDKGYVSMVSDVLDVFDAWGEEGMGWEGEYQGLDFWAGREK